MGLDKDQIKNICFFKNDKEFRSFLRKKKESKWDNVNNFYKWQLIRRNTEYREFYEFMSLAPTELQNSESTYMWGFEPLIDPDEKHPPKSISFYLTGPITVIDSFSFNDFSSKENKGDSSENLLSDIIFQRLEEASVEPALGHKNDKRFILAVFDLDQNLTSDELKKLEAYLEDMKKKYKKSGFAKKAFKTRVINSILEFEKNLFIFDYVQKNGSLSGIMKPFRERFGLSKSKDLSSVKRRLETIQKYVDGARYIELKFNSI